MFVEDWGDGNKRQKELEEYSLRSISVHITKKASHRNIVFIVLFLEATFDNIRYYEMASLLF